jgi:hypothetical protein
MGPLLRMIIVAFVNAFEAKRSAQREKHDEVRTRQLLQDADRRSLENAGLRRRDSSGGRGRRRRQRDELDDEVWEAGQSAFNRTLVWGLSGVGVVVVLMVALVVVLVVTSPRRQGGPVAVNTPTPPAPVVPDNGRPPDRPPAQPPVPADAGPRRLAEIALPRSEPGRGALAVAPQSKPGLTVKKIDAGSPLRCLCWTPEGTGFYTLQKDNGAVTRVRLDGFQEERRLPIGRKCHWLAVCSEGVVVSVEELQEVWLLDGETLDVKGRVPVPKVTQLAASPVVRFVVAEQGQQGEKVHVLDMAALGISASHAQGQNTRYHGPVMTPDGAFVLTADAGYHELYRYRLWEGSLQAEDHSAAFGSGAVYVGICVSPDGKQVALPTGGGNAGPVTGNRPYRTAIFATDRLREPLFAIDQGAYPMCVAFAPRLQRICSQNHNKDFIVFDSTGKRLQEYLVGTPGRFVWQMLVHPEESCLLLLEEPEPFGGPLVLFHIELPQS